MYKLVLIIAMMSVWITAHSIQIEQEMALKTVYLAKQAINRAAHAAAQQLDSSALSEGELRIDEEQAKEVAMLYLQRNLHLNSQGEPLPASFLQNPVKLLVFDIVNAEQSFPYHYVNTAYQYEVWLERPAVIIIGNIIYPQMFRTISSIDWTLKGTAQMTYFND
ncbi:hypothetical protein ACFSTH_10700 [Paenibacillus yanchengensis]|uniref:Uncharacterized protein n=1 Tax=Paenibacillus yanchengensis TaxID=2035833 RepID=A0ABW4YJI3_9BACL